jgi:hypothetical protein
MKKPLSNDLVGTGSDTLHTSILLAVENWQRLNPRLTYACKQ